MRCLDIDLLRAQGCVTTTAVVECHEACNKPVLQVVFGVDKAYFSHAVINMISIAQHDPCAQFHFHIITSTDLSPFTEQIEIVGEAHGCAVSTHLLADQLFDGLVASRRFPASIYYRLLAPFILDAYEQALYLDADMVCLKPLSEVWQQIDADDVVGVVADCQVAGPQRAQSLGLASGRYFNSGVMLMNLRPWRALDISQRTMDVIEARQAEMVYPDQDALNIVLEGCARFMGSRFNYLAKLGHAEEDYIKQVPADTVLLHYAGNNKPWQAWNQQPAVAFYRQARALSPWCNVELDAPTNRRQARLMSHQHVRRKEYWHGLVWRIKRVLM